MEAAGKVLNSPTARETVRRARQRRKSSGQSRASAASIEKGVEVYGKGVQFCFVEKEFTRELFLTTKNTSLFFDAINK
ncbi:MAG: hypothetical protein AB1813_18245 [Verrucomicrobiota bacterium]